MPEINFLAKNIGTIEGLLTAEECDDYIRLSEERHFDEAPVSTYGGDVIMKGLRNNDRVIVDDAEIASRLYGRLMHVLPKRFDKKWEPIGLNERIRFYRYDVGQLFNWHRDDYYERTNGERSFFTFMIYLNDDFEGGGTSFRDDGINRFQSGQFTVRPKKGMALLFHHPIMHRGDAVISGRKYVIRTDVMYGPALRSVM